MIRISIISAAAAFLIVPATFAAETAEPIAPVKSFTQEQAQQHLVRQGYTGVSELEKDSDGRWAGYAFKDGKKVPVAIEVPRQATQ